MLRKLRTSWTAPALLALLLALAGGASAAASTLSGTLETTRDLGLEGQLEVQLPEGAVHYRHTALPEVTLEAASISAQMEWQEGYRVRADGKDVRYYTGQGNTSHAFHQATLTLTPFQSQPELLAVVGPAATATAHHDGTVQVGVVEDQVVTRVEWSEDTQGTGDAPGFWYHIQGAWAQIAPLDRTVVEGDFQLFVNNVTLQIEGEDWSPWTGYKEEQRNAPVSDFETRVTVLHVRDGRLVIAGGEGLQVLGEQAKAALDGKATAPAASGALVDPVHRYTLDNAPLRLEGQGLLPLEGVTAGGSAQGALDHASHARLRLAPDGAFELERTQGVEVAVLETPDSASGVSAESVALAAVLVLAVLAVLTRTHLLRAIDEVRAGVRERRVRQWMQAGDRLTGVRDYERALSWYRRITDRYPTYAEGWYAQGVVLDELGRYGDAHESYAAANELLGGDDPELLDLAGHAAYRAERVDQAQDLWSTLSIVDPLRLQRRLSNTPRLRDETWARQLTGSEDDGEAVSYA